MRAGRSAAEKSGSAGGWVGVVTGRVSAWVTLVAVLLVSGAVFAFASSESSSEAPRTLPDDSEAALVSEIQREFPDSGSVPAVLVVTREDGAELGPQDIAAAVGAGERMSEVVGTPPQGPIPSDDGAAALVLVPVDASLISGGEGRELVAEMRSVVVAGLDDGLSAQLTGGPAFAADTAAAFEGADFRLLAATALVVAVLLILTYRSPVLWLVPLLIIGVADRVAALLVSSVGEAAGVTVDASTSGIVSVLVFGAGTNYALLLISRYREELRRTRDRRTALRDAYRGAVPAILASNITVVLALLTLLLATLPNYRSLGLAAAVGLLVALVYALVALPAALSVCGRGLFWPFIPRPGRHHGRHEAGSEPATPEGFDEEVPPGVWGRIAARVVKRPVTVLVSCVLLLAVLALGLVGTRVGLSQTEQFRTASESAAGLETAAEHFPAGVTDPVTVLTRTGTEAGVAEAARGVEGVVSARPAGESGTGWSRVTVVLDAAPATDRSEDSVVALREAVDTVSGSDALVGGSVAEAVDTSEGNIRDLTLIAPLILLVVFLVLILVLRSFVAPLLVLTATALSSVAALGLGTFVTTQILGFPGLDVAVPLYSFLFLVALGVDYSIFLTIRAREEAGTHATREAMVRAVALTGGVITSAGIVLASVFVVLGVLPLIVLTQVGVIVALGVLLDTFIVRTLVVPALFTLVGDKVWWPGDPRRGHRRATGAGRTDSDTPRRTEEIRA
ncbi:MMPL family transporter [Dietzia cinnamea]|uniref:MMPL family transporter n=1 Tax=Dietzia cinnamea TaxID=321318 RepID=UPI0021A622F3|nr:MMPL family transporter [Dietzia cinnamea]MCT2120632.1 MMPL family transporter [Dietzia cinnamea]MCT2144930.1 MMPL family transporter [Dietzia cinnamea]MCT2303386.1 MMPL family transporter [Dietzia cinnamea]